MDLDKLNIKVQKKPEIISKLYSQVLKKTHFSGDSPPEIFVGRFNYPKLNAGILAPIEKPKTPEILAMPEVWYKKNLTINDIISNRKKLIYTRFKTHIKKENNFKGLMQEISMAYKPVSTEFFLKKPPKPSFQTNSLTAPITNPAPLEYARLQENPKIKPKVDYLVSDEDVKSTTAIKELYKHKIPNSNIIKILSAGLLGLKSNRKLVPTRWAITAVDDILSKNLLKKIKYYPEINEIRVFNGYYVGNHYEYLLLPEKFSFEILEAYFNGNSNELTIARDYERFFNRKTYASNVTGSYYAARLALTEYLEKIKRQAYCIVFREERPEYYAPLGVGILRELSRDIFNKKPEIFDNLEEAFNSINKRLKLPVSIFKEKSILLKEYKKQSKLNQWFSKN